MTGKSTQNKKPTEHLSMEVMETEPMNTKYSQETIQSNRLSAVRMR
jgi:hypothetical protein